VTGLQPKLNILPVAQQALWTALAPARKMGLILYGGTAIALRLGHRQSVDFDFFSDQPIDEAGIVAAMPMLANAQVLQQDQRTLTVALGVLDREPLVKVSFFGELKMGRVGQPETTVDSVMDVASLDDLMATKLKVVLQRAEARDYVDIAAMIRSGVSVSRGLAATQAMYGETFPVNASLRALTYYGEAGLEGLAKADRALIIKTVRAIDGLPGVTLASRSLARESEG
jgi:Nucleotidyl transferase AbiEii toxin, Type IV TA system